VCTNNANICSSRKKKRVFEIRKKNALFIPKQNSDDEKFKNGATSTNTIWIMKEKERSRYTNFKSATRIDTYLLSAIVHMRGGGPINPRPINRCPRRTNI